MQIQDLILSIKQDISDLNRHIAELQQVEDKQKFILLEIINDLFEVHATYFRIEIEKFTDTFQFSCFCFTSK